MSAGADLKRAKLWMFLLGEEANDALQRNDLDTAEDAHRRIVDHLNSLQDPAVEPLIAVGYHQMGRVAEERHQLDTAEQWYRKALAIFERLGHPPDAVDTLAQIGVLMRHQERLQEAVSWCGRAFLIAAKYQMHVGGRIAMLLAGIGESMGEESFASAWREAFQQEPPLEAIRKALRHLTEESDRG